MPALVIPPRPLSEINTTPLIDVLLVLLVMLVITIPAATHSLGVDLPSCGVDCPPVDVNAVRNRVTLGADDRIRWNGTEMSASALAAALSRTQRLRVEPELQFEPEPLASYDASAHVLAIIKASGVSKFGFVGTERFRDFGV